MRPSTTSALASETVASATTQSGSTGATAAASRNISAPARCARPRMTTLSRLRAHEAPVGPGDEHQRHHAVDDELFDLRHEVHRGRAADPDDERADQRTLD